jgi:hypothetical protein
VKVWPEARLHPSTDATVKPIDDRGVIVDMRTGRCWELNRVGFAIWQLVVTGKSPDEAAEAIATRFDVESGTSKRDVLAFVQSLADEGLLQQGSRVTNSTVR